MSSESLEEEQELITQQANELLLKLNKSFLLLQRLNKDIESRPFSTRIHGQFDHELKKSQSIISKLSSLLRKYHSFEFSSNLSLELKTDNNKSFKPIDTSFIINFKDICLQIERQWKIGTTQILEFQSKYGNKNNIENDHYYSDNDTKYSNRKNKNKNKNKNKLIRSHSQSGSNSPIHSFSNPNSPLFSPNKMSQSVTLKRNKNKNKMPNINIGLSQSQILKHKSSKDNEYNAQIGIDFIPYDEQEKLNTQIRDINEDLQYLLDINKQVNDLVREQSNNVNHIENKINETNNNISAGTNTLTSIYKSPLTYGIFGGMAMAVLGAPIILVGVGIKAAIGGTIGLGTVGALSGSVYANKINEQIDENNKKDKKQKLLNEHIEQKYNENNNNNNYNNNNNKGFKTVIRKRHSSSNKKENVSMINYLYNSIKGDDEQEIDEWDARN